MSQFPFVYAGEPDSPLSSVTGAAVRIEDIRKKYNKNNPFVDYDFQDSPLSIGKVKGDKALGNREIQSKYTWARPDKICQSLGVDKPRFAVVQDELSTERYSQYDLKQGSIGNCWYIASLQALTKRPDLINFVIPEDNINGFEDENYCGAFHFRFYHVYASKWVDVVIDDRLPATFDGRNYSLTFCNVLSREGQNYIAEFWPALIEKAYAKFFGDYGKIEGGSPSCGLEDLSGGFGESVKFLEPNGNPGKPSMVPGSGDDPISIHDAFKRKILKCLKGKNFAALATNDPGAVGPLAMKGFSETKQVRINEYPYVANVQMGYRRDWSGQVVADDRANPGLGLMGPHAYTILDAREVNYKAGGKPAFLLNVKNPHGWDQDEWTGRFSDKDDEGWAALEEDLRRIKDGSKDVNEGEFWIDMFDVMKYFHQLDCCYFGLEDGAKFTTVQGVFPASLQNKEISIGQEFLEEFELYKFTVAHALNVEIPEGYGANKCLACIQLVIEGFNSDTAGTDLGPAIAFLLYKVEEQDLAQLDKNRLTRYGKFILNPIRVEFGGRFSSVWKTLDPGTYVIIPQIDTTYKTVHPKNGNVQQIPPQYRYKDIKYAIRLFTENETKLEKIKLNPPKTLAPGERPSQFSLRFSDDQADLLRSLANKQDYDQQDLGSLLGLFKGMQF